MSQLAKLDVELIYPPFLSRYVDALTACEKRGHIFIATRGFATYAEQDAIYAQGRTKPGAVVSASQGGSSIHCFGGGIDSTHNSSGNKDRLDKPDWEQSNYVILAEELERVGLVSGRNFKDWPHGQIAKFVTGKDMAPLRAIWAVTPGDTKAKLAAVWCYLDSMQVIR